MPKNDEGPLTILQKYHNAPRGAKFAYIAVAVVVGVVILMLLSHFFGTS